MIHFYELSTMDTAQRAHLLRRAEIQIDELVERVRPIVEAVRDRGDDALIEFTGRFDRVQLGVDQLRVSRAEIEQAHSQLDSSVRAALEHAIHNIRTFHQRQLPHEQWFTQVAPGVIAGEKITPISSVGLYVPRGKGAFPSVMYMLATPASIAGVPRIVVCTPPGPQGEVDPASLVAADLCGVHEIYRVGGAQAIALADESASPELLARDLLIEAEHGPDSSSLLVTDSRSLAERVMALLPSKMAALPEWRQAFVRTVFEAPEGTGGVVLAGSMREAIDFVNTYAPEHLEVQVREPFALLPELKNAGEILLGSRTPFSTANYSVGTNAVLPTGGFAHTFSCTTVYDFLKRTGIAYLAPEGYASLSETTRRLAEYEGFPAHANAVTERPEM